MSFFQPYGYGSTAAFGSGSFAARMASLLLVAAGIALAVSVVFFAVDVLVVRLLGVGIITLLAVIILVSAPPERRKR